MSKYINDNKVESKKKLSEYMVESNKNYVEYLITILGDVEFTRDDFNMFISQFRRLAGPYDVLTEPPTIRAMFNIRTIYPYLSSEAINCLFPKYIEDLFEKEDLINEMEKFVSMFGYTDEMFEIYLNYIDIKGSKLQEKYIEETKMYDKFKGIYSDKLINHLKNLTLRKHYDAKKIIENIPTDDFIKKDEKLLEDLSIKYRINFGIGLPISYNLIESSVNGNQQDYNTDEFEYIVNIGNKTIKQKAGFNINDFNESKKLMKSKIMK